MNMIDVQDKLKGLSQQQLVAEMQSPSGVAPQFLVLSEITRRKRMQDSYQNQQQQPNTTIAEEAVASAGVPTGGLAAMARSMAPNSSMAQNTAAPVSQPLPEEQPVQGMYGGGYVQKMAGGMSVSGQPADMSNPMVSAWVQREAQRRGVSVEEVLANLGPTGAAISAAAPSMDARNRMLGLEPVGTSNLNFPTQADLDQRYADTQRGDTFIMPSQSDLDLRYQDAQGQQPIFPNGGLDQPPPQPAGMEYGKPLYQTLASRTNTLLPGDQVDLDLTSGGDGASTPDTVRGIDPYTGKFIDVPTPGKMLSDTGQGISDAASYLWDTIGTYRGDPYSELSEAEMADLQSGKMSPEEADRLQSSRLALADIGATELQNPALRPAAQPSASAGETPKPPPPPKDTTPQGGGISTDTAGVPATPNPATSVTGRGSGAAVGGANAPTSYEQELRDAMGRAEKRANQDKWMALAQVGLQLMASKEPTLGGALGEAGIAGLQAFRGSRDAYENERLGLTKSLYDLQQQQAAAIAAQRAAATKATGGSYGIKDIMGIADQYDKAIKSMMVDDGLGGLAMPTDEESVARIAELKREKDKYIGMLIPKSTFDATAQ